VSNSVSNFFGNYHQSVRFVTSRIEAPFDAFCQISTKKITEISVGVDFFHFFAIGLRLFAFVDAIQPKSNFYVFT
jgi:hypothetical protein